MAGSPIKHERNRIFREAIMRSLEKGGQTPEDALIPIADKLLEQAKAGDVASAKEIADRLDGKPAQQVDMILSRGEPRELTIDELKRIAASGSTGNPLPLGSAAVVKEVH